MALQIFQSHFITHTPVSNIFVRTDVGLEFCQSSGPLEHPRATRQHPHHLGQDEGQRPPPACGGRCAGCHGRSLRVCAASSAAHTPDWPMSNPELVRHWKTEDWEEKSKPKPEQSSSLTTFVSKLLLKKHESVKAPGLCLDLNPLSVSCLKKSSCLQKKQPAITPETCRCHWTRPSPETQNHSEILKQY